MKKKLYLFILLALGVCGLRAQYVAPSEGVFRIINVEYNAALAEYYVSNTLYGAQVGGNSDFEQLWFLKKSGDHYTIQNAYTGRYIQTGNNVNEQPYWTDAAPKGFNIVANLNKGADAYNIWDPTLGNVGLHSKGMDQRVVRWGTEGDKAASEWKFVSVEISDSALQQAQAEYAEYVAKQNAFEEQYAYLLANKKAFENALAKYFQDTACTELKAEYVAMDDELLRDELTAEGLPEALVEMAVKVKNDSWAEPNEKANKPGWDGSYAKKFRVQLVEPYSIAGEITEWFGYNAHSNMDNPTGLYGNNHDFLFIFVEGEIKEGAELWATHLVGHTKMPNYSNGYSNGVRLQSGLNVIPSTSDGSAYYINYLVHTYDRANHAFPHKLSEYDDIKVHIEGGYINSYYNAHGDALYTADTDADWMYYEERANLENITILGRHQVLQFNLNDVTENGVTDRGLAKLFPEELPTSLPENQRINAIVEAWDRIMLSEMMTLGVASKEMVDSMNLLYPRYDAAWEEKSEIYDYEGYAEYCKGRDYSEYYNHHGLAFGVGGSSYMYGSWDHCGYHRNTTPSILTQIATEAGPTWGPAHEIGHQHQGLFTVNGLTEVTNNLFSNIAVWYMGMGTSRVNATEGNLAHVYDVFKADGDFFNNNIWALTQMYYRLWLYYHRAGNNTQFYPRLFELLRETRLSGGYYQQGKTSILRFYQHCCDAAQEDLTEFFRAYGFFRVMKNRLVGDYSNSEYTQSQADIDAAIASVKAKGYPVNNKPLFINDATPDVTYRHDGKTARDFWDGETRSGQNAAVGCYVGFMSKDSLSGKYLYTLNNLKIEIGGDGAGALGFAIYKKDGEILAFSNNKSFTITEQVKSLMDDGEASLVAIAAVEGEVKILTKAEGGSDKEQLEVLKKSLTAAKAVLKLSDATGTNVGYYKDVYLVELQALVDAAQKAYDDKDTTERSYGEWAMLLDRAMIELAESKVTKVPLYEVSYYVLESVRNGNNTLEYSTAGLKATFADPVDNPKKHWQFVPTGVEDQYYLFNIEAGLYVSVVKEAARVKAEAAKAADAVAFNLIEISDGKFVLQSSVNTGLYLACDGSKNLVASKDGSGTASQWLISLIVDNHSEAIKSQLNVLLGMVALTMDELVESADPLTFKSDVTILDENLPAYVAALVAAKETAEKAIADNYAYLQEMYDALKVAHEQVKAAYKKALTLPEVSTDEQQVYYYIQCLKNDYYAYLYDGAGRYNGAIRTGELTDATHRDYWFYLTAGEVEGEYYIHNYFGHGLAIGVDGRYLYGDGSKDAVAFTISISEDGSGFNIGNADGAWGVQSASTAYAQFSSSASALWNFVLIGRFSEQGIAPVAPVVTDGVYYDLLGRPVQNPTAGIYIHNGRKVIVK
ncbi:MAG: M60 family metallopeptidase [Bacteroidaceae bacterium]|nr:M60 family metallopeptidase [Bacteroidaceae bacterium]